MGYRIRLIGFDSMGTRGMATVIEAYGTKVFIDPGVSYAPRRYGLPPHELELKRFQKHLEEIYREVSDADYIVITHYHRDHYLYRDGEEDYYRGKTMFIKDPVNNINYSQRIRAHILLEKKGVRNIAKTIHVADGRSFNLEDNIYIEFSEPMPHGPEETKLGYVVMAYLLIDDLAIIHASDVQGPISARAREFIIEKDPDILIISGPPTYMEGFKFSSNDIALAINNLAEIITRTINLSTIIVDHHLLRDLDYRNRISPVYHKARIHGIRVLTAAEYMGKPVEQLEALRKKLWEGSL